MIVARLIQFKKLGGFHFNDSKYGDDDLDSGSINPFQLFLVFNELVDAADRKAKGFRPAYMIDQSHNVTDPIESLITSAGEIVRRLRAGAARRPRRARWIPGRERRPDGGADPEACLHHRRRADPRQDPAPTAAAPSIRSPRTEPRATGRRSPASGRPSPAAPAASSSHAGPTSTVWLLPAPGDRGLFGMPHAHPAAARRG